MTSELQQALEIGSIDPAIAEPLKSLTPGEYCFHKSWGLGCVAEWRLVTGQIIIDFEGKKGHPMQVQYAVQTLQPMPETDLRVRVFRDAASVRVEAESSPVELVRNFLQTQGGKATAEQFSTILVPRVFDAAGFKKWWDSVKKKLKADGHFHVPAKKNEMIELHDTCLSPHQGLLTQLRGARHIKDRVAITDQILKFLGEFKAEELQEVITQIEDAASKGRKLQSAQVLELLLARDEICARCSDVQSARNSLALGHVLQAEELRLHDIFPLLPSLKQRRILEIFPRVFGTEWKKKTVQLAQRVPWRTVLDIARLFERENALAEFQKAITISIAERSVSPEVLYWLCKERGGNLPEIFNPALLIAILTTLENNRLDEGKKSSRLRDLLCDDKTLIHDLLSGADRQTVRDIMRRLVLSPAFDDLSRRSLLARVIKLYPEMQSMIEGDSTGGSDRHEAITVSWISLERRKAEYDDLITRQIPQNIKDIAIARSYGDLRENFEYKSAKEQQAVLARRQVEMEQMLANARGTNFESPDTSQVSIGTVVTLEDGENTETYSILGAWDGVPENNIVSYQAAIGQTLLGKRVGETVELPGNEGEGTQQWCIRSIEPFKNFELLSKVHNTQLTTSNLNNVTHNY